MTPTRHASVGRLATRWMCLLALIGLTLAGTGAHAASPGPPASGGRLASSLLTADDLPGFLGSDLDDPTELDLDQLAFDEHRGSDASARAWASPEMGVVFDQRMLFPTDEAALSYLVSAEPTLSEADDAGLVLVQDDPLTPATRHWAGEALIGADRVAMDVWLIPAGPVVAKVAATVFGPGLDMRRTIAERALARLEAAYGPADAIWPAASPARDPDEATPSYASDLELLQRLMQAVLRTGARGCEGDRLQPSLPGEVVVVSCDRDGAVVVYRQFADPAARDAAFESLADEAPAPDVEATSCRDGAYRGPVTEADRTWSVACWEASSGLVLLWTEPDQPTLGAIIAPLSSDVVALWEAARVRS